MAANSMQVPGRVPRPGLRSPAPLRVLRAVAPRPADVGWLLTAAVEVLALPVHRGSVANASRSLAQMQQARTVDHDQLVPFERTAP